MAKSTAKKAGPEKGSGQPPATAAPRIWEGAVMLHVSQLEFAPWNVNKMSEKHLAMLMDDVENDGFDEPLQVVELPGLFTPEGLQKYRIIGGEHRMKVARALGMPEIPCVIKPWQDEEVQKVKTVRRNFIRGDPDRDKFTALSNDLMSKHALRAEDLPDRFGLSGQAEYDRYYQQRTEQHQQTVEALAQQQSLAGGAAAGAREGAGGETGAVEGGASGGDPAGQSDANPGTSTPPAGQPKGMGDPVISYSLIFDDEDQQRTWFNFVKFLKVTYPTEPTIGARLARHLRDSLGDKLPAPVQPVLE